ncbi:MAG: AmmeMemoRadiSam system protein B [Candidatus Latescibacterota bacterium]|nr:MAG: AmmeMemoRadiSam system protein B [Candidatus Latescibacterota bacterium]
MNTNRLTVLTLVLTLAGVAGAGAAGVRQPAVAGQFYPSDPVRLANAIDYYLEDAITPTADKPVAIISPHAGYVYSGQIAADAFKQAQGHDYDLVIIVGANHTTGGFRDVSIYAGSGYQTPLGIVEIDEAFAAELTAADEDFTFKPAVHEREHSVEVQIPFVQMLWPRAKIVTAIIGRPDLDLCRRFGKTLADKIEDRNALIVASTDFSHYPTHRDACEIDRSTLETILSHDAEAFREATRDQLRDGPENLVTCACGAGPVMTALAASEANDANGVQVISYANSGDTAIGKHDRVVGYAAVSFSRGETTNRLEPFVAAPTGSTAMREPSEAGKRALLDFARKTIRQYLSSDTAPLARGFSPELCADRGVFVTLKKQGALRGCIGHMTDDLPLCQVVGNCALQAAFNDRRFPPLEPTELNDIDIEISILTPYLQVDSYRDITLGRDGVMIEKNGRSAVFLPYVAVEQGWDRDEMLANLCRKAGLSEDAWEKNMSFYVFQAIEFGEPDFR